MTFNFYNLRSKNISTEWLFSQFSHKFNVESIYQVNNRSKTEKKNQTMLINKQI